MRTTLLDPFEVVHRIDASGELTFDVGIEVFPESGVIAIERMRAPEEAPPARAAESAIRMRCWCSEE